MSLAGRTAVISGASSGIGLATAERLHALGADVHALSRRADATAGAERLHPHRVDVTDAAAVAALAGELAPAGRLDVLVCAAGTNVEGRRLEQLTPADWAALVETNLSGVFHLVSACLPALRAAQGLVIVVGSVSGAWPDRSGPGYQAAKAGALGFARAAGLEEHGSGVRFSVVAPGMVDTPLLDRRPEPPPAAEREQALRPQDVAEVCAFLAGLPARIHVPELTVLPTALQVLGRTG